ncbi:hypothetical protein AD942_10860 [Gluconobacter japonicus]|nr:hypothetical protein AD942_10860 [Gluconobacter japonicus]
MEETVMAFTSVSALEGLVNQSLGKADTPTVQQGISVGGLVLQGVLAASMSKLAEHVDITAFDAALTKTLEGATDLERVIATGPVTQTPAQ